VKLTKRKSFSFYRSYYDVFNELKDVDKLIFIEALFDKQFLDKDPDNLKGMVKFAYISQMDSIDKQVKGYCDKTKTPLNPNKSYPWQGGESDPRQGVYSTPTEQEKEKEKEKEQQIIEKTEEIKKINVVYDVVDFIKDWNTKRKKHLGKPSFLNRLGNEDLLNFKDLAKDYKAEDFNYALIGLFKQKKLPNGNTSMQSNPKHFLTHFNSYLTAYYDKNNGLYGQEINHAQTL